MAEATITEESIRAALTERLKATHVEIQDMSGTPRSPAVSALTSSGRQKTASHRQQPSGTLSSNSVRDAMDAIHLTKCESWADT